MTDNRQRQGLRKAVIALAVMVLLAIATGVIWRGLKADEPTVLAGTAPSARAKPDSWFKGLPGTGVADPFRANPGDADRDRVLYYSFEQSALSANEQKVTIADISGNGNAGTVRNVAVVEKGAIGSAGGFNGRSSFIVAGNGPALQFTGQFTLAVFVKLGGDPVTGPIIAKDDWQDRPSGFSLRLERGRPSFNIGVGADGWREIVLRDELPANEWHHLAATFDGRTMRLYVNGAEADRKDVPESFQNSGYPLLIGMCPFDPIRKCAAEIDEVMVFSSALSEEQVRTQAMRR